MQSNSPLANILNSTAFNNALEKIDQFTQDSLMTAMKQADTEEALKQIIKKQNPGNIVLIKTIETILLQEQKERPQHDKRGIEFLITQLSQESLIKSLFELFSSIVKNSNHPNQINERMNLLWSSINNETLEKLITYQDPNSGDTLFHLAARVGNSQLIDFFFSKNCNPFLKNNANETPFYWFSDFYIRNINSTDHSLSIKFTNHANCTSAVVIAALELAIAAKKDELIAWLFKTLDNINEIPENARININGTPYTLQHAATKCGCYQVAYNFILRSTQKSRNNKLYSQVCQRYNNLNMSLTHQFNFSFENVAESVTAHKKKLADQMELLSWLMDFYHEDRALEVATQGEFFDIAFSLMQESLTKKNRNSDCDNLYTEASWIYKDVHQIFSHIERTLEENHKKESAKSSWKAVLILLEKLISNPDDSGLIDTFKHSLATLSVDPPLFAIDWGFDKEYIISLINKLNTFASIAEQRLVKILNNKPKPATTGQKISHNNHDEKIIPTSIVEISLFHTAIKTGDLASTQLLLTHNPGLLNAVDSNGLTALHHAILSKHPNQMEIFNYLIQQDPQLDLRGTSGFHKDITPLWIATHIGNIDMMTALIAKKADVNLADTTEGSTPLMNVIRLLKKNKLTAEASRLTKLKKAVAQLLNNHANPNQAAHNGITALHWAIRDKDPEVTQLLIEHKANIAAEASAVIEPFNKLIKIKPLFFSTPHHQQMLALLDQYAEAKITPIPAEMEDGTPITLSEVAVRYGHTQALTALTLRIEFSPEIDTLAKNFSKTFANCPQDKQAEIAIILIQYLLTKQPLDYENLLFDLWRFLIKDLSPVISTVLEDKRIAINQLSPLWNTEGLSLLDIPIADNKLALAIPFIAQLKKSKPDFSSLYEASIDAYQEALSMQATQQLSTEESEHLKNSLFSLNNVLLNPTDKVACAQLKRVAYEIAPGKPSFWKKFIGALLTVAAIALSIVAGVFSLGIAVIAPTAIIGGLGCGIFAKGLQKNGLSKKLAYAADRAEQTMAASAIKN